MTKVKRKRSPLERKLQGSSVAFFLLGLGVLLLSDANFWPWILLVIGVSSVPYEAARQHWGSVFSGVVWAFGLPYVIASGMFWPGILYVAGLSIPARVFGCALKQIVCGSQPKAKRGLHPEEAPTYTGGYYV